MRVWLASLRNGFGGVLRFTGRDSRVLYWPYVATVLGTLTLLLMAAMLPIFIELFVRMERFAIAHPDQATITQGPGSYSITIEGWHPELMPDFTGFLHVTEIGAIAFILLIAAATVRRLRDNGRGLWWALLPLPFLTTGLALFPVIMAGFQTVGQPRFDLFLLLFANNATYLAMLALLSFQLGRAPRVTK